MKKIIDWLDLRTDIRSKIKNQLSYPVPPFANFWFCFGGLAFLCILIQFATGVVMLFYYVPEPARAQDSIKILCNEVFFGGMTRNLHRWAATFLLLFLFVHAVNVITRRAYQSPRELNWWSGILLYFITFISVITGIILPWDWRSYWELVIWTDWIGTIPFIGNEHKAWFLSIFSLKKSFAIHIWLIPFFLLFLLLFHFKMVRKLGVKEPL